MIMFSKYKYAALETIPITDEMFADLQCFRSLAQACRSHGHHMAIVTFGRKEVVQKALVYALGAEQHGISIKTPGDFGFRDGSGELGDKNTQLAALAKNLGFSASQIILVDDDQKNIDAAADVGVNVMWTPNGLTRSMCGRVAQQVSPGTFQAMTQVQPTMAAYGPASAPVLGPLSTTATTAMPFAPLALERTPSGTLLSPQRTSSGLQKTPTGLQTTLSGTYILPPSPPPFANTILKPQQEGATAPAVMRPPQDYQAPPLSHQAQDKDVPKATEKRSKDPERRKSSGMFALFGDLCPKDCC
jgi:hypothetical protein